jgi:hypothetical protein
VRLLAALLLLWPAVASAGVCDRLVLVGGAAGWSAALAEAGLQEAAGLGHCGAALEEAESGWSLLVRLAPGDERRSAVPAPRTAGERLDIAILAASLLAGARPPEALEDPEPAPSVAVAVVKPAPSKGAASKPPVSKPAASSPAASKPAPSPAPIVVDAPPPAAAKDVAVADAAAPPIPAPAIDSEPDLDSDLDRDLDRDLDSDLDPDRDRRLDSDPDSDLDTVADAPPSAKPRPVAPFLAARLAAFARPDALPTIHGGVDGGVVFGGQVALGPTVDLQGPWSFTATGADRGVSYAVGGGLVAGWTPVIRPVAPRLLGRLLVLARRWHQDGELVAFLAAPVLAFDGGIAIAAGPLTFEPSVQIRVDLRRTELIFPDDSISDLVPVAFSLGLTVRLAGGNPRRK